MAVEEVFETVNALVDEAMEVAAGAAFDEPGGL